MKKSHVFFPLIAIAVSSLTLLSSWDKNLQDQFIKTLPETKEDKRILLLNIDDESIENIGVFPWPRKVYGEAAFKLSELGASNTVFDLLFMDSSPVYADTDYLEGNYTDEMAQLFSDMENGDISSEDAFEKFSTLSSNIKIDNDEEFERLLFAAGNAETGFILLNDKNSSSEDKENSFERFSIETSSSGTIPHFENLSSQIPGLASSLNSAGFINATTDKDGKIRSTYLLMEADKKIYCKLGFKAILQKLGNPEILVEKNRILLKNAKLNDSEKDISIPLNPDGSVSLKYPHKEFYELNGTSFWEIYSLISRERLIGDNLNVLKDEGVFNEKDDKDLYSIEEKANEIKEKLIAAEENGEEKPSFNTLAESKEKFYTLLNEKILQKKATFEQKKNDLLKEKSELSEKIKKDAEKRVLKEAEEKRRAEEKLKAKTASSSKGKAQVSSKSAATAKATPKTSVSSPSQQANASANKNQASSKTVLTMKSEEEKQAEIELAKAIAIEEEANKEQSERIETESEECTKKLEELSVFEEQLSEYVKANKDAKEKVSNAICFIGTSGTGSSDYYNTLYGFMPGVSTYYVLYNMILSEDFIHSLSWWISLIIAFVICFTYSFASIKLKSKARLITGIVLCAIVIPASFLYFYYARTYVETVIPFVSILITFVTLTSTEYLHVSKEKNYIRTAFGKYLSDAVVDELIANPEKLCLGGANKNLTAIFTDIRGFSSLSEKLTAPELINLLNMYLSTMSDIIMKNGGTIDKYEGDAIIAFFGTPAEISNTAVHACRAAIQMKKAEVFLNTKLKELGKDSFEFFTRIGINTGDMVVGNVGTSGRMNYTMIGNEVNLASRLEGVNKIYNTKGIAISENTYLKLNGEFVARPLDQVRVVGINKPVRIYELMEESAIANEELLSFVAEWTKAVIMMENKEFDSALPLFEKFVSRREDDEVAKLYLEKCRKLSENPPFRYDPIVQLTQK